jgi:glycosyltransferase involved in cell wall biosynthesis
MSNTVVSVVSTLARCGPVNVVGEIVEHLERERYQPVVITLSHEGVSSRIDDFRESGVPVMQLNMSRPSSFLVGWRKLKKQIESIDARLVHCHGFRANHLVRSSQLTCPVVSTIHSDLCSDYRLAYGSFAGNLMAHREYAALRDVDAIVAVSPNVAERAAEFGLQTEVIPNGVDLAVYSRAASQDKSEGDRERLGWPRDRIVVLHTGALVTCKQPLGVINAFRRSDLLGRALLVFAGDGPLLAKCKGAVKGLEDIVFLGHRSDLSVLLRAADAVVSNSTSEGLPMALLEACACGLRVVASDIGAHRHIARLFPEQVDLFPLDGGAALADRMNALGRSGRTDPIHPPAGSLETISAKRMTLQYQKVYDRILSGPPAADLQ